MEAIVCKMCGSNDLVKKGRFYICANCGTKYAAESVERNACDSESPAGTDKLYTMARQSFAIENFEDAYKYYKELYDKNPDDWEAFFFTHLLKNPEFDSEHSASVAERISQFIPEAFDMALTDIDSEEAARRARLITESLSNRLLDLAEKSADCLSDYERANLKTRRGNENSHLYRAYREDTLNTVINCLLAFDNAEEKLEVAMESDLFGIAPVFRECLLTVRRTRYIIADMEFEPFAGVTERLINEQYIIDYARKVHEIDPSFEVPDIASKTNRKSGCFIATAAYGSYDCPEVWTLRRYRDYCLAGTTRGRAFIRVYYAVSPKLVRLFGNNRTIRLAVRRMLDHFVQKLQREGYSSKPYKDQNIW